MRNSLFFLLLIHRRYNRDAVAVGAESERCGMVIYRDEVVKSNVAKSAPPSDKKGQQRHKSTMNPSEEPRELGSP